MKKIITTLCVIFVAALGAQGQSTVTFPNTGTNSFTNLTFESVVVDLPDVTAFTRARLLIGASGLPSGTTITFSNFTLAGQGIATTLNFVNILTRTSADNLTDPTDDGEYVTTSRLDLTTPIEVWNSANNRASFQTSISGPLPAGAQIYYAVQYSVGTAQINTAFSNINLVAVPEPSTYFAAVGLLGLCLWSARRQLFKFAGSRSTSSGAGSNGAA